MASTICQALNHGFEQGPGFSIRFTVQYNLFAGTVLELGRAFPSCAFIIVQYIFHSEPAYLHTPTASSCLAWPLVPCSAHLKHLREVQIRFRGRSGFS
jgi:hypothetical protein